MLAIFVETELLNCRTTGIKNAESVHLVLRNYVILTEESVPTGRHELAVRATKFWCQSPSALYSESQLKNEQILHPQPGTISQ